jgi:hypothetical protein
MVGGVLGQDAGRVGDGDAALDGGGDVDIVDAVAEIGDQLELLAGFAQHRGVDAVGDGGNQHIGGLHRLLQLGVAHRRVVVIEADVEKLAHAQLDAVGQFACDNNQRFLDLRHLVSTEAFAGPAGAEPVRRYGTCASEEIYWRVIPPPTNRRFSPL